MYIYPFAEQTISGSLGGGGPVITTTWSPTNKNSRVTLSNGNRTASSSGANIGETGYATSSISAGQKIYFEVNISTLVGTTEVVAVGLCNVLQSVADGGFLGGGGPNSIGWWNSSNVYFNGSVIKAVHNYVQGNVCCFATDFDAHKLWVRTDNGLWDNTVGDDPATGVGGLDISGITGPLFPAYTFFDSSGVDVFTGTFGGTFSQAVPAGFLGFT
jgi:hypothetical protein